MELLKKPSILLLISCLQWYPFKVKCLDSNAPGKDEKFSEQYVYTFESDESFDFDISLMVADIKYRPGEIKILEFGEGTYSQFRGYDKLYSKGAIWTKFWLYLMRFNLPIWFVCKSSYLSQFDDRYAGKIFKDLGGKTLRTFSNLFNDRSFLTTYNNSKKNYKGIVIDRNTWMWHYNMNLNTDSHNRLQCQKCKKAIEIKNGLKDYLILNDASNIYGANKRLADSLFDTQELRQYRPAYGLYKKQYDKNLAKKIIDDLQSDIIVIKPQTAFKGNGVIIAHKDDLDAILFDILNKTKNIKNSSDKSYNHWVNNKNKEFIVESYEGSKPVEMGGKLYDGTMRIVFTLHHKDNHIYVNFLGSYWKLPSKSIDEVGSLNDKSKSFIGSAQNPSCSTIVDEKDYDEVKQLLKKVLPQIYHTMLIRKKRWNNY